MPLSDAAIDDLATRLVAARRDRSTSVAASGAIPTDDADAYRVQKAVMAKLGATAAGWKVGTPNAETTPNCAPIFAGTVQPTGSAIKAEASTGVEVEIAYVLGKSFAASSTAPSRADVEGAISAAHVVLELCASRLTEGLKSPPHLQLADSGSNLGLLIGPKIENWRALDLKSLRCRLVANGATIADTTGGHSTCDLIGLLTWLVGHCVKERGGIAAGTIVTTGSWMGIRWVDTPAEVAGIFDGVGEAKAGLVKG